MVQVKNAEEGLLRRESFIPASTSQFELAMSGSGTEVTETPIGPPAWMSLPGVTHRATPRCSNPSSPLDLPRGIAAIQGGPKEPGTGFPDQNTESRACFYLIVAGTRVQKIQKRPS